jgi:diguanylate cyclase (GGDEF)-like protein/PAS domain S-box-containing protein
MTEQWPALLCVLDFQGRFKQVNSAAWQQLGISAQLLYTTTFTHWLHPDDLVTTEEHLSKLGPGQVKPIIFENRWRDAKGEYHWLLWSATVAPAEPLIYAVGLEITEQKQLEQYYQGIVKGLHEGVLLYDAAGKIRVCNPSAEKLLGGAASQWLGQTDWQLATLQADGSLFPEDSHPAKVTLRTETACHQVVMGVYKPDNVLTWLSVNSQPLRLQEAANTDAVVLSISDISERKHLEDDLQEKVTLLTSLFETATIGIAILDENGRFVRVNPTYSKIYGYRPEELLGQLFTTLLPPPIRKEATLYYGNFWAGQEDDHSKSWPMQHRDGKILNNQRFENKITIFEHQQFKVIFVIPRAFQEDTTLTALPPLMEAWLPLLFKHLPVTVVHIERDGYLTFAQGPLMETLGLTAEQVRGQSIFAANHKLAELSPDLERALSGETFSKILVHAGLTLEANYLPVIKDNDLTGMLVLFKDLTEQRVLKSRLKNTLQELELLAPYTPLGLLYVEAHKIVRVNRQGATLLGYTETELLKTTIISLFRSTNDYHYLQTQAAPHLVQAHSYHSQQRLRKKDGSFIHCSLTLKAVNQTRIIWLFEEVSDLANTTTSVDLSTALWATSNEAILITDTKLTIQQINPAAIPFTGYSAEELINKTLPELDAGRQDKYFYQHLLALMNQVGQWHGNLWQRHKNNAVYVCELKLQAYNADQGTTANRYVAILSNKQTSATTSLDPLTNLPTRMLFRHNLLKTQAVAQRYTKRFAILLIGIDDLPALNAKHGCVIGDLFLQTIGQSLKTSVRDSDTVARYGGDIFGVNLEGISKSQDAGLVAQMMLFKLTQPFLLKEQKVQSSVSIGIVVYPDDGNDVDTLLELALATMRRAKQRGGGQCCFHNPQLQETFK